MHIQKEEAEALRRILAILAPRLSHEERQIMARNLEARISGTHTSIIAFRYWQIAALCHPGNPEKAQEMESQIVAAVDSGELLPSIDDRSLKGLFLSDLSAWPECPPIAEDSPLRVWLPFVPTVPAQAEASPVEGAPSGRAGTRIHSTKSRRDAITPAIEAAQGKCRDPQDTAEVWGHLQALAHEKHPPFIGVTEDGLQVIDRDEYFKKDDLRKRLARLQNTR